MAFYLAIFFAVVFLTLVEEILSPRQRKGFDIAMLVIIGSVSALHGIGGSDYFVYYDVYRRTPDFMELISDVSRYRSYYFNFEPGYLVIITFLKSLGFSFGGYIVVQNIFFYTAIYIALRRYTTHFGLIMLVFLYKMFFYDTFISMRQPITIAIFLLSIKYIELGKPIKYFILAAIAATIHNGAFLLFPLYCLRWINPSRKFITICLFAFLPTAILAQMGIGGNLNHIMTAIDQTKGDSYSSGSEALNIFYTLEYYLVALLALVNYRRIISHEHGAFIFSILLVMLPFLTLFSNILILRRELDYFFLFYGIIIGYLCDVRPKFKFLIILGTICICLYGYVRYLTNFDQGGLIPYKTWIETIG